MKVCMYAGGEGVLENREVYTGGRRGLKFSVFIVYVLYGWPLKGFLLYYEQQTNFEETPNKTM